MMKAKIRNQVPWLAALLFFWLSCDAGEVIERPTLILGQGEQRVLKIPGLLRFSLGDDCIRARPLPAEFASTSDLLLLKGATPGISDLWVWKTDGSAEHRSIRVEKVVPTALRPAVLQGLNQLEQAEILLSGSGVILRGEIKDRAELARIQALKEGFPQEIRDETDIAAPLLTEAETKIHSWLGSSPYSRSLSIGRRNGTLFIEGAIDRAMDRKSVEKKIKGIFPAAEFQFSALPDDSPTVHFRVFLIELKRDRFHSFGLSWPPGQEGAFRITARGIQDLLQLDLTLQALAGEGSVRILSNPELVVRAPGEAELFSGGELPIESKGHYFSSVSWKNFGLLLKLKVHQVAGERVRLDIQTEVSHLDPQLSSENKVPGLQANRMKTQVDAQFGRPLLLSGLVQQNLRSQARGLPGLRQIPVLGVLFGSEDYLNEKSELIAILVPSSSPPSPSDSVDRMKKLMPKGALPPPRNWISPEQEQAFKKDPSYPWNALD